MSGTVKTVLIVGGAALGVALILRATSSPAVRAVNRQQSGLASLQGLIGVAAAAKGLFDSSPSPNTPTAFDGGAYSDPASQATLRNFDTSNYSVSNGFAFTDASGRFIAG